MKEEPMADHAAVLMNRANNVGRPCCDLLREAAALIELLQHRIRHGDWPKRIEETVDDPSE